MIDLPEGIPRISVDKIKFYEKNSKQHPKEQIKKIKLSFKEFGFNVPVIIDKDNVLIAGHGRIIAAKELNMSEVTFIRKDKLTPDQVEAYRIMDNKSAESKWIDDNLSELLTGLQNKNYDLALTGFDNSELMSLLEKKDRIQEDETPESNVKTDIKVGDVFLLGKSRLMCGDSKNTEDVNKLTDGQEVELLLTDPPYGINIVNNNGKMGYGNGKLGFKGTIGSGNMVPVGIHRKIIGDDEPFDPTFLKKYGKHQIIFGGNYFASKLPDTSCWIIWDKRGGSPSNNFADCEIAWTSYKKPSRILTHKWNGLLREGKRNEELIKRVHPTQKPVGLFANIINDYTKGGAVMDLFGGSGTTLIAAEKLGGQCFIMELDPVYCEIIKQRWETFTNKKATKQ